MKYLYFLLFGLFILGLYQYKGHVLPTKIVVEEKIPSPDEMWEKQQQVAEKLPANVELPFLDTETIKKQQEVIKATPIDESVDFVTPNPVVKVDTIPTPDQLWEQQHQENRENDVPAIPSDYPVISQEQRNAEALADQNTDIKIDQKLFENDQLRYTQEADEYPPSEVLVEVIPFELRELEKSGGIVSNGDSGYAEPLIDPTTGISDKELMEEDGEPASEVELKP
jgi:hypothetical protein